ncbi:dipeptidase PepE [Psychromicrobium xiongbiense]|uniref:dipeptidase PepE n=1 Tax=Psychromicrobium xiongbiense TaxID=3051184 RepID=UPI0025538E23|nr:dipeptidase PepE [Psychromicrobium sp. YIM S02556]
MTTLDLLLFSNSTNAGRGYLEHAQEEVADFLAGVNELLFVPFALQDHEAYTTKVGAALASLGVRVIGLHSSADPAAAVASAEAVFVGGGNTFRLVSTLQRTGLLGQIRAAAQSGIRYMGASAGTNIAAPTIRTTNDMPIVEPPSFEALGLVPFQINPHYLDAVPGSTHAGETREMRLTEFLEENDVAVLGLREGSHLRVTGTPGEPSLKARLGGEAVTAGRAPGITFRRGYAPEETSGEVTGLWDLGARYDDSQS